jgi:hypothetical protein
MSVKNPEPKTIWCCLYEEFVELPDGNCDSWCDFDCDATTRHASTSHAHLSEVKK